MRVGRGLLVPAATGVSVGLLLGGVAFASDRGHNVPLVRGPAEAAMHSANGKLAAAPTGFRVVMGGLDNPRGLATGRDGAVYVTEAGHGGDAPCATMRGMTMCYGPTGAVARLKGRRVKRVATGLPSYAPAGGNGATGPQRLCFDAKGRMFVTYGLGMNPTLRPMLGSGGIHSGYLMRITGRGVARPIADISGFEAAYNPAGGPIDSNPFGLVCDPRGEVVTDAGGNDLFRVSGGEASLLAVFPARPVRSTDSVPTTVVVGPKHIYYVGELSGAPFNAGAANVYRIIPSMAPQVYLTGFTDIIDMALAADGSLYVLEYATGTGMSGAGALIKVSSNGTRSTITDSLDHPTALLVGRHGAIYVTNHGTTRSGGELLKLTR